MTKLFQNKYIFYSIVACFIAAIYILLHNIYHIHYVDNAWTMSFAYSYIKKGLEIDIVFRPESRKAFLLFGRAQNIIYGVILNIFGWSKSLSTWISTLLMAGTAFLWYFIGKKVLSKNAAIVFSLSLLTFTQFLNAANLARAEAPTIFISSIAMLLFIKERYFFSAFAGMLAFENHPMGATSFFYMLGYAIYRRKELFGDKKELLKKLGLFFSGIAAGVIYYFALHGEYISFQKIESIYSRANSFSGSRSRFSNYIHYYFHHNKKWLLFFLFSILVYLKKRLYKENALPLFLLISVLASSLILKRASYHYAVYMFPPLLLITIQAFAKMKVENLLLVVFLCSMYFNHIGTIKDRFNYDIEGETAELKKHMPKDDTPVVGLADYWFGFKERKFYPCEYQGRWQNEKLEKVYFITSDYGRKRRHFYRVAYNYFNKHYSKKELYQFKNHKGKPVKILLYTRKKETARDN